MLPFLLSLLLLARSHAGTWPDQGQLDLRFGVGGVDSRWQDLPFQIPSTEPPPSLTPGVAAAMDIAVPGLACAASLGFADASWWRASVGTELPFVAMGLSRDDAFLPTVGLSLSAPPRADLDEAEGSDLLPGLAGGWRIVALDRRDGPVKVVLRADVQGAPAVLTGGTGHFGGALSAAPITRSGFGAELAAGSWTVLSSSADGDSPGRRLGWVGARLAWSLGYWRTP